MSEFENNGLGPEGSYYDHLKQKEAEDKRKKDEASFPIIITITYLILGFVFHLWHPGWLIFLFIPFAYIGGK